MKKQRVNRKTLISRNDPWQGHLLDPWEHLGSKRHRLLENSRAGLFRQEILAELPVDQIAPWFRTDFGRPSKELYTVLGVLLLQQMHGHTDAETVQQLAFHYLRYAEKASRLAPRRAHQQTMEFRDRYRLRPALRAPCPNMTG